MDLPRVQFENLGPIECAEIKIRPITIFIGGNSTGKSIILRLIWALSSVNYQVLEEDFREYLLANREQKYLLSSIIETIARGENPENDMLDIVNIALEHFREVIHTILDENINKVLGVKGSLISKLIKECRDNSYITVITERGSKIELTLNRKQGLASVDVKFSDDILDNLIFEVPHQNYMRAFLRTSSSIELICEGNLQMEDDIIDFILELFYNLVKREFKIFLLPQNESIVCVDTRAYSMKSLMRFCSNLKKRKYSLGYLMANIESVQLLSKELGIKFEVDLLLSKNPYIVVSSGRKIPLKYASSGVRECLLPLLALAVEPPPSVVFIEEPEARLYPRAHKTFARFLAETVSKYDKYVLLSTHSIYIIDALYHLINVGDLSESDVSIYLYDSKCEDVIVKEVYINDIERIKDSLT